MCRLFNIVFQLATAFVVVFIVLVFPAHSMNLPIQGEVANSTEVFSGMATVYLLGDGNLTLTTNKGVTCTGKFVHASQQKGHGTVICDDGRLGVFEFVTAGFTGSGAGMIGAEHFDFRIGK